MVVYLRIVDRETAVISRYNHIIAPSWAILYAPIYRQPVIDVL